MCFSFLQLFPRFEAKIPPPRFSATNSLPPPISPLLRIEKKNTVPDPNECIIKLFNWKHTRSAKPVLAAQVALLKANHTLTSEIVWGGEVFVVFVLLASWVRLAGAQEMYKLVQIPVLGPLFMF